MIFLISTKSLIMSPFEFLIQRILLFEKVILFIYPIFSSVWLARNVFYWSSQRIKFGFIDQLYFGEADSIHFQGSTKPTDLWSDGQLDSTNHAYHYPTSLDSITSSSLPCSHSTLNFSLLYAWGSRILASNCISLPETWPNFSLLPPGQLAQPGAI